MRTLFLTLMLVTTGCPGGLPDPLPDRVTLGVQLDADSLEVKTYTVQGQWIIRK